MAIRQDLLGWVSQQLDRRLRGGVRQVVVDDSVPASIRDTGYTVRVAAIEDHQGQAVTLYLEMLEGYRLRVRAGQFVCVTVQIGQTLYRRCYSLCSTSEDRVLAITIKRVFQGRVSNYLNDHVRVGDQLTIDDPAGEFVLPETLPGEQRYVFVAAGSGIAPIFGLISELLGTIPNADVQLVYSNRSKDHAIFRKQLRYLEAQHAGFRVHYIFTRRADGSVDPKRRLTGAKLLGLVTDISQAQIYICGPTGLTRELMATLHDYAVPDSAIRVELFSTHPNVRDNTDLKPRAVAFRRKGLLRSTKYVRQRQVETVLETARKAKIKIASQCQVGTCKSCKVKLKRGHVIMEEPNALTVAEAEQGYILSCVAYPCDTLDIQLPPRR